MQSLKRPSQFVHLAFLLGLTSCSDATQFTERAMPYSFDAVAEDESSTPNQVQESSLEPVLTSKSEAEEPLIAYEGSVEPSETSPAEGQQAQQGSTPAGTDGSQTQQNNGNTVVNNTSTSPFSACQNSPQQAIVAQVYTLPASTTKLPDFSSMMPVGDDVCLRQLNITERRFSEGFPGVPDLIEWFALDMHFQVNVPDTGTYKFTLKSDDGSILYIDDQKVIDNDGLHETKEATGSKFLSKGMHTFHIKYYQGPRYHIALELFWNTPGASTRTYIPEGLLSRP